MNIEYLTYPFEHVIIKNFFTEEETKEVLEELNTALEFNRMFTSKTKKFKNSAGSENGTLKSDRLAFNLDEMFKGNSKTNKHCHKIFYPPLSDKLVENSNFCNFLRNLNYTGLVVGVYKDGDYYLPHYDASVISLVGHVWQEGTSFEGGELYFPEYNDYSISPEFNKFIIFPSYILHGVKKVKNTGGNLLASRISIALLSLVAPNSGRIFKTSKD